MPLINGYTIDFSLELGVARGRLMNICKISRKLSEIYQIEVDIYGFDTGEGMPVSIDFRDHPELYQNGDLKKPSILLFTKLPLYFDDNALWSHNSKSGELLAIHEFNASNENRVIENDLFIKSRRIFKSAEWLNHIYYLHILDANLRTQLSQNREAAVLSNPYLN